MAKRSGLTVAIAGCLAAIAAMTTSPPPYLAATAASTSNYVDFSFSCPAITLCPQVCAPTADECPTRCSEDEDLCADGSCVKAVRGLVAVDSCPPAASSPCGNTSPCAPVACAAAHDTVTSCQDRFAPFYTVAESCQLATARIPIDESGRRRVLEEIKEDEEHSSSKPDLSWTNCINLFAYLWGLLGTAGIIAWCWYKYVRSFVSFCVAIVPIVVPFTCGEDLTIRPRRSTYTVR